MLLRGFIVSCECILRWKAKLLPVIGDVIAQAAPLSWTPLWQELYPMNHTAGPRLGIHSFCKAAATTSERS